MKYPTDPRQSWGYLIKDVSRLHSKRFEQRAGAFGLTLPQCRALLYLSQEEGITQVQLAALTDIEPMTLVRMIDRMEADGWLERRGNPSDRRTRHLYFKPKGRALLEYINRWIGLTREEALAGVSKRQIQALVDTLTMIRSNLDGLGELPLEEPAPVRGRRERRAQA